MQVQGDEASAQIANAIRAFNRSYAVDVLIVGRGGGSMEDLWAFNEETTIRAVAASRIPIISAVGHETDFTLTDLAADVRAATPSHAAELAVLDYDEWQTHLTAQVARLQQGVKRFLREKEAQYSAYSPERLARRLELAIERKRQTVDFVRDALVMQSRKQLQAKRHRLELGEKRLSILCPENALKRGYSILTKQDGAIIRTADALSIGDRVEAKLVDGNVILEVVKKELQDEKV